MNDHNKRHVMYRKVKRIHFVGIGGIGMSGIAEVLLNLGYMVSGSDLMESEITQRLEILGARISYSHSPENLKEADVVVTSTAIKVSNPEVVAAHERVIPVIPRAEMLAELLKMKFSIAVSGSHGKTTVTSMMATVLAYGGLDPTMVVGGKLIGIGTNAKMGEGEVIVAEADESDGSFLKLNPTISVITNIDLEHLDYYRDIEEIKAAFLKFANIVPFYGSTILCIDCKNVKAILPGIKRKYITYGIFDQADYQAKNVLINGASSEYTLYYQNNMLGTISLNMPGMFNVYNSMAAIAVARELDMEFSAIREGLKSFSGVHRRLEVKGEVAGIKVVDDYGHHPTEIKATLSAARQAWDRRIVVIFQPHRYSRTKHLFNDFLEAFDQADSLFVTRIYPAGEEKIEGISGRKLSEGIKSHGHKDVRYISEKGKIVDQLIGDLCSGDVVITLGAGDIWRVGEELLKELQEKTENKS
jgi:UDP-N-acetylmuramate--alanine ligase